MNLRAYANALPLCAFVLSIPGLHATAGSQPALFTTASIITDNMVLQQRTSAPLWGRGMPGTQITVQSTWGATSTTEVRPDSTWELRLQTPKAGGPYRIAIGHDDTTLNVENVLIGEVWLCSGQSNMEMPLMGWPPGDTVRNASMEIAQSTYPEIRFFTVKRAFSALPESRCAGSWAECSPATSPSFSATAFYFGKKLFDQLHVPIGLIHSSWGGTAISSWISDRYLSTIPGYDTTIQKVREARSGQQNLQEWLDQFPAIDMRLRKGESRWAGLSFSDEQLPLRSFPDSAWRTMQLPQYWETTEVGNLDGVVWFRKQMHIPPAWVHHDLVLGLGPIDDIDVTYVNGVRVGSHEGEGSWRVNRTYNVQGSILDSTLVQIAVRVIDYQGGGGIFGDSSALFLHPPGSNDRLSLSGEWKYAVVAEYIRDSLFVFGPQAAAYETRPRLPIDLSANTPTALYNGMIAPLLPFAIRGAIWYQGESDTRDPSRYPTLFPLLIANWRNDFGVGEFPFYYVQIAPFEYGPRIRSEFLREAQTSALSVKNTGMAVTLDIGNPGNIHPSDKQDVGNRLALWALAKTYHRKVPYSGPLPVGFVKHRNDIEVRFNHAEKGLLVKPGGAGTGFQIAGADRIFKNATVRVQGNRLFASNPDVKSPQAIRYAFTNAPEATLFNGVGLPAPSFRSDDWEH